jgi:hypothetical protein
MEGSQKGVYMPGIFVMEIQSSGENLLKRGSFWHSGPSDVISVMPWPWGTLSIWGYDL